MQNKYKQISIHKAFHGKFTEFCKNQNISIKEGTENLLIYAMKHQLDLSQINDNATSSAKELINRVGNKVQNLQNTYVSFQRTFESEHNYFQLLNILMTYQNKKFETKEKAIFFKQTFFEQAILIRISTHPQQKLINDAGGARAFYSIYVDNKVKKRLDNIGKMAIFEIIEVAHKLVNDVISSMQKDKIKK